MRLTLVLLVVLAGFLSGCWQVVDEVAEKQKIRQLMAQSASVFQNGSVDQYLTLNADTSYRISEGVIDQRSGDQLIDYYELMTKSRQQVLFDEQIDEEMPVIHISADGNMAWAIWETTLRFETPLNHEQKGAAVAVYRKENEKWLQVAFSGSFQ